MIEQAKWLMIRVLAPVTLRGRQLEQTHNRYTLLPNGSSSTVSSGEFHPGQELLMLEQESMEELFDLVGPDLDEKETNKVKALIRWILQYDPAKRPSPARILNDPRSYEINVMSDRSEESIV